MIIKKRNQAIACKKAVANAVTTASVYIFDHKWEHDKATAWLNEKLKEIQRKYGLAITVAVVAGEVVRYEAIKIFPINKIQIPIFFEPLVEYYKKHGDAEIINNPQKGMI
jgi:hypothetical protein